MQNETLLIVEDNQILKVGLKEMLSMEGFAVITASNGQDALEQMKAMTPDLILSDISMPVMDGFTFFSRVRQRPDWVTIPFIFLTARGEREDIMTGRDLGAEDYLVKPISREELLTAVRARLARSRQLEMAQLQNAYEASLTMLANAIEVRSEYTRGHVERVTAYALELARYLGFGSSSLENRDKRLEGLRYGAILHDIGKIHVRESVLTKKTPLTADEWIEVKQHPITGAELIKHIPYLLPARPVILYHHENWDGKGYPHGLRGEEIPLEARIVSVADGFDAMTTERSYHRAHSPQEAYDEIVSCSGGQYDPAVVGSFQLAWERGEIQKILGG
jgi:putative two-component system response regulator